MRLAEEQFDEEEAVVIRAIVRANLKTLVRKRGIVRRGQHAKHHSCVRGRFSVLGTVPENLRRGVFAKEASFNAWVRFSNGTWSDDRKSDAHGMAIKLLDVSGKMLLDNTNRCQDFILVDHPVYFTSTLDEYRIFNRYYTRILDFLRNWNSFLGFLPKFLSFLQASFMLRFFYPSLFSRARAFASKRPFSPLAIDYFSTTPYLLGDRCAVKYMARSLQPEVGPVNNRDGLSLALAAQLRTGVARFEFGVHLQEDAVSHPIEDATVDWAENGAPFVPIAVLEIPQQEISGRGSDELAENIAFSPWNSLSSHRPLGVVNRIRKEVYLVMANLRHKANGVKSEILVKSNVKEE